MAELMQNVLAGIQAGQALRNAPEVRKTNALNRQVTERNLLRQQQGDVRGILGALDAHAAKGAAWASQDQTRLPAFQAEMLKAIDQAEQTGLPSPMAEQARQRVQTITFDQLGPIAAQAGSAEKPVSALEQARQAVLNGTATPEQRRMAGTLAKEGAAPLVNIEGQPQFGTIPPGWQVTKEGNAYRMEPIAGGPAEQAAKTAEETKAAKNEATARYSGIVFKDISRLKEKVENSPWYDPVMGMSGALVSALKIPRSNRIDAESLIPTIESGIGFDRLQAMRDAAPTGGALGQISDRENELLKASLGNLSLAQSEGQLLQNIDRLNAIYAEILRKAQAYPNAAEFGFATESAAPQAEPGARYQLRGREIVPAPGGGGWVFKDTGEPAQ